MRNVLRNACDLIYFEQVFCRLYRAIFATFFFFLFSLLFENVNFSFLTAIKLEFILFRFISFIHFINCVARELLLAQNPNWLLLHEYLVCFRLDLFLLLFLIKIFRWLVCLSELDCVFGCVGQIFCNIFSESFVYVIDSILFVLDARM